MANLAKLEFERLDISGKNYMSWKIDAETHLAAKNLEKTIQRENNEGISNQTRAQAMIFLRHHVHENLKMEYLTVNDPLVLWENLKERYDHLRTVILPKAHYDWIHLRLQDFKTISEYNSMMYKITSQLKLCGENITDYDMLEKTFSTFHASNMLLQQQYREKGFKRYSELISCLLVAEQNNEVLMKNHESRPTGSAPFPEANGTMYNERQGRGRGRYRYRGRGRGRGRRQGRGYGRGGDQHHDQNQGRGIGRGRGRNNFNHHQYNDHSYRHQKWNKDDDRSNHSSRQNVHMNNEESSCFRCGMKGHWSRTCRTAKHLVDLYERSQKGKNVETNFLENNHDDLDFDFDDMTNVDITKNN